jgi:hypothetical protein
VSDELIDNPAGASPQPRSDRSGHPQRNIPSRHRIRRLFLQGHDVLLPRFENRPLNGSEQVIEPTRSTALIEVQISHVYCHYCKAGPFLAVVRCMPQQSLLCYQPRLSVLGCFALLHAVRFAKRQIAVRTG